MNRMTQHPKRPQTHIELCIHNIWRWAAPLRKARKRNSLALGSIGCLLGSTARLGLRTATHVRRNQTQTHTQTLTHNTPHKASHIRTSKHQFHSDMVSFKRLLGLLKLLIIQTTRVRDWMQNANPWRYIICKQMLENTCKHNEHSVWTWHYAEGFFFIGNSRKV